VKFLSTIGRATLGRNVDVSIGRAACEACSAKWNMSTNSAFAVRPRNAKENRDRVGRSQDLTDPKTLYPAVR
jgi:hypothetical protein